MEKYFKIKSKNKHVIYGTLNYKDKGSGGLIIFVHGLTGNKNEHQFYNAVKFFNKNGFTTFRFDLYSGEKKGRILTNSTITSHSEDLNSVIHYFKNKFNKIYLVGHSLGGPVILYSNLNPVYSMVLWDPSVNIAGRLKNELMYNKKIKKYILSWGTEYLLSKEMLNEWKDLDSRLISKIIRPTKIICAGKGILYKDWKKYLSKIKPTHDFFIIKKAGHCFDEEGIEDKLFLETLNWFKKDF